VSFLDLDLKPDYDSETDDILSQFYIPVLSTARRYHRLAGFFSSSSLAVAARGISAFVQNEGHMKLLVGARLQQADIDAVKQGKESPEKIISEMMLKDLQEIEDEITKDHVRALAWLVAKGQLDIKVALVIDRFGQPMDYERSLRRGIFHQKVGILEDDEGNVVSFSGSVNETAAAWEDNIEEFKVFRSWVEGEAEHLAADKEKFDKYWWGQTSRLRTYDIPLAVRQRIVELAPSDIRSLKIERAQAKPALRDYQKDAISRWFGNSGRGIFEMATGVGKTFAAIGCMTQLLDKEKRLVVVVACPFTHLIRQWEDNMRIFGFGALEAFSGTDWEDKVANAIFDFNNGNLDNLIVITTHETFSSERFLRLLNTCTSGRALLIADEVHGVGAPERRKGLDDRYQFRLGLSATPTRLFDEEGTAVLRDFFGEVVYEFSLGDAIKRGFLSPYEYQTYIVELSPGELEEYKRMTQKIASEYSKTKDDFRRRELAELFSILRHRIVINASQKYEALNKILEAIGDVHHCLIYCSPQQIERVQDLLNRKGIIQHKFTAHEDAKERRRLLELFSGGQYRALVAMRCLDEGLDVPSTRLAIMMASSTNPREFIQRRGRVLRMYKGKENAIIYDIIVVPTKEGPIDPDYFELEARIMKDEIRRYMEFAKSAINSGMAYSRIAGLASKYHIRLEDLD